MDARVQHEDRPVRLEVGGEQERGLFSLLALEVKCTCCEVDVSVLFYMIVYLEHGCENTLVDETLVEQDGRLCVEAILSIFDCHCALCQTVLLVEERQIVGNFGHL